MTNDNKVVAANLLDLTSPTNTNNDKLANQLAILQAKADIKAKAEEAKEARKLASQLAIIEAKKQAANELAQKHLELAAMKQVAMESNLAAKKEIKKEVKQKTYTQAEYNDMTRVMSHWTMEEAINNRPTLDSYTLPNGETYKGVDGTPAKERYILLCKLEREADALAEANAISEAKEEAKKEGKKVNVFKGMTAAQKKQILAEIEFHCALSPLTRWANKELTMNISTDMMREISREYKGYKYDLVPSGQEPISYTDYYHNVWYPLQDAGIKERILEVVTDIDIRWHFIASLIELDPSLTPPHLLAPSGLIMEEIE